jgi:hypothetical protein
MAQEPGERASQIKKAAIPLQAPTTRVAVGTSFGRPGLVLPRGSRMPWNVDGLSVRRPGERSQGLRGNWG